jgi:malate synthase
MTAHFLRSYSLLLIKTCHQRGAHAMGGMAAQIPIKNDPAANEAALAKVRADKEREATDGHDGTWVAHPALVPIAKEIFDRLMKEPNQLARQRQDVDVTAADLLAVPKGDITEAGLVTNISVGIAYLDAWLRGTGCVPLHNLMEDAATAEISRAQVWQWLKHGAHLKDGRHIDRQMCESIIDDLRSRQPGSTGDGAHAAGTFDSAAKLFEDLIFAEDFPEFLTLPAYELIAHDR